LNTYWPSLNGPSQTFWAHEFEKHGTCTDFPSQLSFFNGTLSLRAKYDIVAALATAGIVPSNTVEFTLSAFNAALVAAYGHTALLTCDSQGRIETATFCVTKAGALMECPSTVPRKCSGGKAFLPASMAA